MEERKIIIKRYESEFKDISNQKIHMKNQLDDYEKKIKTLIRELEEESKKHIKEINDVHEHYRGYKNSSKELEERIKNYKNDYEKAVR